MNKPMTEIVKQHPLRLLNEFPMIDINAMGFPEQWDKKPLWKV